MIRRLVLIACGTAAAVIGLALAALPGFRVGMALPEGVSFVVGLLAVVAGLYRARSFLRTDEDEFRFPDRERGRPVVVPGQEFDDLLSDVPRTRVAGDGRWLRVREELREAAVRVLVTYHGVAADEAESMIEDGTWTEDRLAAEFFTTPGGTGTSIRESFATTLGAEGPFHRRARRTAREIHRLAGGDES